MTEPLVTLHHAGRIAAVVRHRRATWLMDDLDDGSVDDDRDEAPDVDGHWEREMAAAAASAPFRPYGHPSHLDPEVTPRWPTSP